MLNVKDMDMIMRWERDDLIKFSKIKTPTGTSNCVVAMCDKDHPLFNQLRFRLNQHLGLPVLSEEEYAGNTMPEARTTDMYTTMLGKEN